MKKVKWEQQVKEWEDSLKYSDPKKIEVNTLLREIDFKNKIVLDVGSGPDPSHRRSHLMFGSTGRGAARPLRARR